MLLSVRNLMIFWPARWKNPAQRSGWWSIMLSKELTEWITAHRIAAQGRKLLMSGEFERLEDGLVKNFLELHLLDRALVEDIEQLRDSCASQPEVNTVYRDYQPIQSTHRTVPRYSMLGSAVPPAVVEETPEMAHAKVFRVRCRVDV